MPKSPGLEEFGETIPKGFAVLVPGFEDWKPVEGYEPACGVGRPICFAASTAEPNNVEVGGGCEVVFEVGPPKSDAVLVAEPKSPEPGGGCEPAFEVEVPKRPPPRGCERMLPVVSFEEPKSTEPDACELGCEVGNL